ncbi:MAG: fatty acid desaturase [Gemmatimonadetes bacterium]|nr:MAG: fatty acid desaturase [Gemmatimonadota bacterium]
MTDVSPVVVPDTRTWRPLVARYQSPQLRRAVLQLATTLLPLALVFAAMYRLLALSFWWTLVFALPAAALLVRTFVLMHDCAHGSFFASRRANQIVGAVTGLLTLIPFEHWRHEHALHHASAGDLDRRGHGDVDTLTVREYLGRTRWGRLRYRIIRHPLVFLVIGPLFFVLEKRFPPRGAGAGRRQIVSVWTNNAAIVLVGATLMALFGARVFLIYLPAYYVAVAAGLWLFFVQHQFEETYWEDHQHWDYAAAAIAGSSYFKLPAVLQWVTGSIGFHHVHHLGPRIPNYNLQQCHDENPMFQRATVVTLRRSLSALRLALWDEDAGRLVSFDRVRHAPQDVAELI